MNVTRSPAMAVSRYQVYKGFRLDIERVRTDAGRYTASVTVTRDDGMRAPVLFQRGYPQFPAFDNESNAVAWAIGTGEAWVAHS